MKKDTKNKQQLQQGDTLYTKLAKLPASGKVTGCKRIVVAHGESGHSHIIEDDEAELIQVGERMLLSLPRGGTVVHEEHAPVRLETGIWEVGRVREYDYFQHMERQVVD